MVEQIRSDELIKEAMDTLTVPPVSPTFTKEARQAEIDAVQGWLKTALDTPLKENTGKYVVIDTPQAQQLAASIRDAYEAGIATGGTPFTGQLAENPLVSPPATLSPPVHVTQLVRERVLSVTEGKLTDAVAKATTDIANKFEVSGTTSDFATQVNAIVTEKTSAAGSAAEVIKITADTVDQVKKYAEKLKPLADTIDSSGKPDLIKDMQAATTSIIASAKAVADANAAFMALDEAARAKDSPQKDALEDAKGAFATELSRGSRPFKGDEAKVFNYVLQKELHKSSDFPAIEAQYKKDKDLFKGTDMGKMVGENLLETYAGISSPSRGGAGSSNSKSSSGESNLKGAAVPVALAAAGLVAGAMALKSGKEGVDPTTGEPTQESGSKLMKALKFAASVVFIGAAIGAYRGRNVDVGKFEQIQRGLGMKGGLGGPAV